MDCIIWGKLMRYKGIKFLIFIVVIMIIIMVIFLKEVNTKQVTELLKKYYGEDNPILKEYIEEKYF